MARNKETVLRQVRALIDRADHPNTPKPEADAARAKADELMLVYAIESWQLPVNEGRPKPELREFNYGRTGNQLADDELHKMFYAMARHCGVEVGFFGWYGSKIVGYPADLDYLDLMFTSARLYMSSKINPTVNPEEDLGTNVARFKHAGWKFIDMHFALQKYPDAFPKIRHIDFASDYDWRKDGGVMFRAYKKWLKDHPGEDHIGANPKSYQAGFVLGFVDEVRERLWQMGKHRKAAEEEKGYGIVLANRTDLLKEFLWEQFPELRPHPPECQCRRCNPPESKSRRRVARTKEKSYDASAYARGRKEGANVDLSAGRNNLEREKGSLPSGG